MLFCIIPMLGNGLARNSKSYQCLLQAIPILMITFCSFGIRTVLLPQSEQYSTNGPKQ